MNISNYTKIAIFFIVLGVSGGAYIITSSNNLNDFNTYDYETIISDATGITTRSKIYQAGVVVGRVKGVTLSENEAILRISLLKDLPVRESAVISRKASSILGTSVLTIEPGETTSHIIFPGGRINSAKDTSDMNAVFGSVNDLSEQLSQMLYEFQKNQLALLSISLETFNSIAQKLDARTDAELERVSRILESIALITEEINRGQGNIGQAIYDDQLYKNILTTASRLNETLESINIAAVNANTVIDNANVIVERAVGLGIQVDTFGNYFTQASQVQAGASLRLVPTSNDRWYRIGVSSVPNGYSTRTVTESYSTDGSRTQIDTTETKYSVFVIDAELARSLGLITIRGGLIENSGGIGLDVNPLKWLGVSGELYNFKSEEAPNLRGSVVLYPFFDPDSEKPWNWLYLKGGISNSLNSSRDFFIGGGMRFADREIKSLVGLLPVIN